MFSSLPRKIVMAIRFIFPSARERDYERVIARAGVFDTAFYLRAHAGVHRLFKRNPLRHYIQHGEAAGFSPNGRFSPRAYLFHNPDLDPATTRPLLHYVQTGQHEARTVWLDPKDSSVPDMPAAPCAVEAPARVAVVLHLYYLEMWDEFASLLEAQTFEFDLWVTLSRDAEDGVRAKALRDMITSRFARAQVHILPNHGRDIFPFVWLVRSGVLAPYSAVCKLHSKKSPHLSDGDAWRQNLTEGILGEPEQTRRRLETFITTPGAGFWVAEGQHYEGDIHWGVNHARATALMARRGLSLPDAELSFPAGSIYWIGQAMIAQIAALDLDAADFEPEQALVDGTTAHALERLFGSLAQLAGQDILTPAQLDPPAP